MGVEAALIATAAAAAVTSVGSVIANSQSINAQKDMYNKQRADQLADYNERTGILAQGNQLASIGVNPASAFSSQAGSASMGSVPNPAQPVFGNPLEGVGNSAMNAISAFAKLKHADLESAQVQETLQRADLERLQAVSQQTQNYLLEKYGDSKAGAELLNLYNNALLHVAERDYKSALTSFTAMQEKLGSEDLKHKQTENSYLALQLAEQLNLTKELVTTEKTRQGLFRSQAAESSANASTINAIRSDVVRYQKALANIQETKDFVSSNTAWNEVQQSLYELQASKLVPSEMVQAIERAKKKNDWFVVEELLGIVDTGTRAVGTAYGAKTGKGFVDAQNVRNDIQRDYNNWLHEHPQKKVYNMDTGDVYYSR